jgi:hypothetical protein
VGGGRCISRHPFGPDRPHHSSRSRDARYCLFCLTMISGSENPLTDLHNYWALIMETNTAFFSVCLLIFIFNASYIMKVEL